MQVWHMSHGRFYRPIDGFLRLRFGYQPAETSPLYPDNKTSPSTYKLRAGFEKPDISGVAALKRQAKKGRVTSQIKGAGRNRESIFKAKVSLVSEIFN